jgi:hypothetical protein
MVTFSSGVPAVTLTTWVEVCRLASTTVSSTTSICARRSYIVRRSGWPQPWCVRVRSLVVPVKVHWLAVLINIAFAVVFCGADANTDVEVGLPNAPWCQSW